MEQVGTIRVLAFGALAQRLGWSEQAMALRPGDTVGTLRAQLALGSAAGLVRIAVNQAFATDEQGLAAGDEVALIPPVSGG